MSIAGIFCSDISLTNRNAYAGEELNRTKQMGENIGELLQRGVEYCGKNAGYEASKNCAGRILNEGFGISDSRNMIEVLDNYNRTRRGKDGLTDYERSKKKMGEMQPIIKRRNDERKNNFERLR